MLEEHINRIKEILAMIGNPILVQYCDTYDKNLFVDDPCVICQSLQEVRFQGSSIVINEKNSVCRGGNFFLGLSQYDPHLIKFWKDIEKSHKNTSACFEFINNIKPIPFGLASNVLLSSDINVLKEPDLVVFICNAASTARFLGLYNYSFGNETMLTSYSSACSAAIGIPMGQNKMNVTFIDNSARKIGDYDPDELMITIPICHLEGVYKALDECVWGEIQVPYHTIEEKFCGNWIRPDKREE